MIAWEDDLLSLCVKADELLEDIQKAVLLEDLSPKVGGHIVAVIPRGISCAAIVARAVAALIKRQKESLCAVKLGRHHRFIEVHGKERQNAMIQLKG